MRYVIFLRADQADLTCNLREKGGSARSGKKKKQDDPCQKEAPAASET